MIQEAALGLPLVVIFAPILCEIGVYAIRLTLNGQLLAVLVANRVAEKFLSHKNIHCNISTVLRQTLRKGGSVITLYGIPNCDSIKKAKRWLESSGIEYRFHNYRSDGLTREMLEQWISELGWETLLNRRGTTWRKLPESEKSTINADQAIELMLTQPAIIKRPLLDTGKKKLLGFSEESFSSLLQ